MTSRNFVAAASLVLAASRQAAAQPADAGGHAEASRGIHRHDGLFFRQGLGLGLLRSRGRSAPPEGSGDPFSLGPAPQTRMRATSGAGAVAHVALGGTLAPGVVLAAELASHMFWALELETEEQPLARDTFIRRDAKYLSYGGLVVWYPSPKGGFCTGLSLALASAHLKGPTGWLAGPEVGYSWWVGEQWSIGALLRLSFSELGDDTPGLFGSAFIGGTRARLALPSLTGFVTFH